MTTWSKIYQTQIKKKGGLLSFVLGKEKRSVGALIRRLRERLHSGAKILEVGTGTGAIGALLSTYTFNVIGIDNDREMLKLAQQSFSLFQKDNRVFLVEADDIVDHFGKNSFNCVISHGLMEHYPNEKIIEFLRKELEISPLVVFVVPTKAMSSYYRSRGLGNERYLPTKYWKTLLKNNGFLIKNIFGFGFKETNIHFIPEKILQYNLFSKIFAPLCAFNEFWLTK